ncbi:unnamed protein product, partial [Thlaspi arvense]
VTPTTGNAYVHRTFLALNSDPLKTRLDLIYKQANDHVALVNAYGVTQGKLKIEISRQLRKFDDLAQSFSDLALKPAYRESLLESDGPVDEEVLRKLRRRLRIVKESLNKAKKNGALS